jgi:hypothetical protein
MVQDVGATMVTLVWLVPGSETDIRLAIQMLDERNIGIKYYNRDDYRETQVRGQRGSWLEQPHIQLFYGSDGEYRRLVSGNVLIWTEDRITYRLEVDAPLDEAVTIAESMQ